MTILTEAGAKDLAFRPGASNVHLIHCRNSFSVRFSKYTVIDSLQFAEGRHGIRVEWVVIRQLDDFSFSSTLLSDWIDLRRWEWEIWL